MSQGKTPLRRPGPLPLITRIQVHNLVVQRIRAFLQEEAYVEIPVPELTPATGSCEVVDSMFTLDYFGALAFPRQTGQLYLEEVVARGVDAVYCEGESLRKERQVDERHLTEFKLIEIEKRDMSLEELCDFQEKLLKNVASVLGANEIGGGNVTRLDRMLRLQHPRMTYREAIGVLRERGFAIEFGDDLGRDAEAALIRHCGDLPIHVTHFPETLKFFNMKIDRTDPAVVECVDYILPYSGETFGGSLREPDVEILRHRLESGTMYGHLMKRAQVFARNQWLERRFQQRSSQKDIDERDDEKLGREASGAGGQESEKELAGRYQQGIRDAFESYLTLFADAPTERAGFGLGVARLLQYLLGLSSIKETVPFPMDRTRFGGLSQTMSVPR